MRREWAVADPALPDRVGGDMASGADGAVLRAGDDVPQISRVTFTSEERVRDVIHNFNADAFESLYPRYKGGRQPKFSEAQRERSSGSRSRIRRIAGSRS